MTREISEEIAAGYLEAGWWTHETLGDVVSHGLAAAAQAEFRVYSEVEPYAGTFSDVEQLTRRLAGGLRSRGVGPGDVVAFQLPNWVEAAATFWATALLGAAVVPIVHFYGPKEVSHIIATARPKVFITAKGFGRMAFDREVCADVPVVGVVGDDFDRLLADEPMAGTVATDPSDVALIAFTSGTTRAPKGVLHSHRTLICESRQLAQQSSAAGRSLTATPVGHFIGMVGALLIPLLNGMPVHMVDQWDPGKALALIKTHELSLGGGPPYFFTSLFDHPDFTPSHLANFGSVGLGGSSVPVTMMRRLESFGLKPFRSYGSTEHPSITGPGEDAPEEKRLLTDGCPRPGVEIRIAADGEILSRGPDLCLGYLDAELTAAAFDEQGWYHTGDVGILDDNGYLTITDRKSDLIIRAGENVSPLEVEEVLLTIPGVAEAVVVAAPDTRLGERVAAVMRLHPGHQSPTLPEVRAHFEKAGTARQKWPEELHVVEDFPRTASGKVQKVLVRKNIADNSALVLGREA